MANAEKLFSLSGLRRQVRGQRPVGRRQYFFAGFYVEHKQCFLGGTNPSSSACLLFFAPFRASKLVSNNLIETLKTLKHNGKTKLNLATPAHLISG